MAMFTLKYHDGSDDVTQGGSMSVKDRKQFRSVVCSVLDQPGIPETVYVSQMDSATGPEFYWVVFFSLITG